MYGLRPEVLGAAEPDREVAPDVRQGRMVIVHPISHRGAATFHGGFAALALIYVAMGGAMAWFHLTCRRRHLRAWRAGER